MLEKQSDWRKYESYTQKVLNQNIIQKYFEEYLKLLNLVIKPKKKLLGRKTETMWEVDAYGYDTNNQLILIECKHYKDRRVTQNTVAAFAYIIQDIKAEQGIIVTTQGLQKGAIQVAKAENIALIQLHYNSTDKNFFVNFSSFEDSIKKDAVGKFTEQINSGAIGNGVMIARHYSPEEVYKNSQNQK
ncbi:MAG: restriction endonuclease [Rivularia sp. (in: cyanobacteria)]